MTGPPAIAPGYLTLALAAQYVSRSPKWIRRRLDRIPHVKDGGLLIAVRDLERYLTAHRVEPAPQASSQDAGALLNELLGARRRKAGATSGEKARISAGPDRVTDQTRRGDAR